MSTPATPKVGFVSLGCPKALVDSERILTQLRMEGYEVVSTYQDADVVVVNTCGFIDSAKAESLEVIGEAIKENGKVIVTGCMGVEEGSIRDVHPSVLSVTGPQQYEQVVNAVHEVVPPRQDHNPLIDLVPPQGIKLTPRHYAYLKISEGCNHSCSFCIIPSMRGKLVSRPVGEVLSEAERLVKAGVKELLVISQDTSAYGVDLKYKLDFWNGQPVKTRMLELCEALSSMGVWVRLHYVYPYPHVDGVIELGEQLVEHRLQLRFAAGVGQVGDRLAHLQQLVGKAEHFHVSPVPRDDARLGVRHRDALRDVLHGRLQQLPADANPIIATDVVEQLEGFTDLYRGLPGEQAYKAFALKKAQALFAKVGWEKQAGESDNTSILRSSLIGVLADLGPFFLAALAKRTSSFCLSSSCKL